jgi:hypothetical protein
MLNDYSMLELGRVRASQFTNSDYLAVQKSQASLCVRIRDLLLQMQSESYLEDSDISNHSSPPVKTTCSS